tara:strand:+ start:48 stop:1148 length:1101 start_codon:yes stop_codon:yes gene_type:complete
MKVKFNDLARIHKLVSKNIKKEISKIVSTSSFILGEKIEEFENSFSTFTDSKYSISCANGTDAIELVLRSFGIKKGDEVLIPANTFIATALAVSRVGAQPIFYDCDEFFLSDVVSIEKKITKNTKVIIGVNLYGQIVDVEKISKIAKKYNLYFIEDSAQAHGSKRNNHSPGKYSDAATYSFYPGKNLGAWGDGGAITTNNYKLKNDLQLLRNWGSKKKYIHEKIGFNSRLDPIQAVVLIEKLKYLEEWNSMRSNIANLYFDRLEKNQELELPMVDSGNLHTWHLYVIKVKNRKVFLNHLSNNNIETVIHYPKIVPHQQAYKSTKQKNLDYINAYKNQSKIVSLPLFPLMTTKEVDYVTSTINNYKK